MTPLIWKERVVFAGRNEGGTRAIRLRRDGDRYAVEELWKADAPVYMSSPVIHGDSCFAIEHVTGRMSCLRLEDGTVAWKDGAFGDYASLVLAGDRILVLASSGKLTVVEATREAYRPLGSWQVSTQPTYAHLVVAGSRLIVRDAESISVLDLGSPGASGSPGSPPAGTSS